MLLEPSTSSFCSEKPNSSVQRIQIQWLAKKAAPIDYLDIDPSPRASPRCLLRFRPASLPPRRRSGGAEFAVEPEPPAFFRSERTLPTRHSEASAVCHQKCSCRPHVSDIGARVAGRSDHQGAASQPPREREPPKVGARACRRDSCLSCSLFPWPSMMHPFAFAFLAKWKTREGSASPRFFENAAV